VRRVVCHKTEGEKYPNYFIWDSEGCIRHFTHPEFVNGSEMMQLTTHSNYWIYHFTVTKYLRFRTQRLFPKSNWSYLMDLNFLF